MITNDALGDRLLTALIEAAQSGTVKTKAAAFAFTTWCDKRCKLCHMRRTAHGNPRHDFTEA